MIDMPTDSQNIPLFKWLPDLLAWENWAGYIGSNVFTMMEPPDSDSFPCFACFVFYDLPVEEGKPVYLSFEMLQGMAGMFSK